MGFHNYPCPSIDGFEQKSRQPDLRLWMKVNFRLFNEDELSWRCREQCNKYWQCLRDTEANVRNAYCVTSATTNCSGEATDENFYPRIVNWARLHLPRKPQFLKILG